MAATARGYGADTIVGVKQLFDALNRERSAMAVSGWPPMLAACAPPLITAVDHLVCHARR